MDDRHLLDQIIAAKKHFGVKCSKYASAVTIEWLRHALGEHGIGSSPRSVFIRGVPAEIDLLIPKSGTAPENGLLYHPEDVLVAMAVKNSGSFGDSTINDVQRSFRLVQECNPHIRCLYVTLSERTGYKWAVSDANVGAPTYTLFWHAGSERNRLYEPTGEWECLIADLKRICREATLGRTATELHIEGNRRLA